MKKYFINSLSILLLGLVFTSCSNKIYFTNDMRLRLNEYDLEISKVQFYTSDKMVFKKVLPFDSAAIANGEIKFENGKLIDNVIIKKNTPGTCEIVEDGLLNMAFESGENKFLIFKLSKTGKYYELLVSTYANKYGELLYDNEKYIIQVGSEKAKLLVKKNEDYLLRVNQRVVKGKKVN